MHFVVTAGPTIEHLDDVRRLTNFSTGRLGTELALHLNQHGHDVTLLRSEQAVYRPPTPNLQVVEFSNLESLRAGLVTLSRQRVDAVFHAAAVCDFGFGQAWQVDDKDERVPIQGGKLSTRSGRLVVELIPTPKLIAELRDHFPEAWLVGWKYEVDGGRPQVLAAAERQLHECRTDACVANGPAYGNGYGLALPGNPVVHLQDTQRLFDALRVRATGESS